MYDIDISIVKKNRNMFIPFLIFGLVLFAIIIGVIVSNYIHSQSLTASTMSTSVTIDEDTDSDGTTYSPVYQYEVDSETYTCFSSASASIKPSTNNATVYYNPNDPEDCSTDYDSSVNIILFACLLIPVVFILIAVIKLKEVNKRLNIINELNNTGKLVKGLEYSLEPSGISINKRPVLQPVVEYTTSAGMKLTLRGDPRFDNKEEDHDGLIDLVIDESRPDYYFLDFEINRKTGNNDSDYYKKPDNTF